jgi:hypothetical protein
MPEGTNVAKGNSPVCRPNSRRWRKPQSWSSGSCRRRRQSGEMKVTGNEAFVRHFLT